MTIVTALLVLLVLVYVAALACFAAYERGYHRGWMDHSDGFVTRSHRRKAERS